MIAIQPASARVRRTTSFKVRVHASLLCGNTTGRVVDQHGVQKIESVVIQIIHKSSCWISGPFWEGWLEVRERCYTGPVVVIGGTKKSKRC